LLKRTVHQAQPEPKQMKPLTGCNSAELKARERHASNPTSPLIDNRELRKVHKQKSDISNTVIDCKLFNSPGQPG
jgi:hypothetical protein